MLNFIRMLFYAFEDFYSRYVSDDESYDPEWMDIGKWKATRPTR